MSARPHGVAPGLEMAVCGGTATREMGVSSGKARLCASEHPDNRWCKLRDHIPYTPEGRSPQISPFCHARLTNIAASVPLDCNVVTRTAACPRGYVVGVAPGLEMAVSGGTAMQEMDI